MPIGASPTGCARIPGAGCGMPRRGPSAGSSPYMWRVVVGLRGAVGRHAIPGEVQHCSTARSAGARCGEHCRRSRDGVRASRRSSCAPSPHTWPGILGRAVTARHCSLRQGAVRVTRRCCPVSAPKSQHAVVAGHRGRAPGLAATDRRETPAAHPPRTPRPALPRASPHARIQQIFCTSVPVRTLPHPPSATWPPQPLHNFVKLSPDRRKCA